MKNFVLATLLFFTTLYVQAQSITTHTVQRGETIESVAQKYGVSVADLTQANPDLSEYFFVGMKLTIPNKNVVTNNNIQAKEPSTVSYQEEHHETLPSNSDYIVSDPMEEYRQGYSSWIGGIGFTWLMGRGDFKKSLKDFSYSTDLNVGYQYNVADYFALSAGIGWRLDWFMCKDIKTSTPVTTQDLQIHYIEFPVMAHLYIASNPKIKLFGGVKFNVPIAGRLKKEQGKDHVRTKWKELKKDDSFNGLETDLEFGISYDAFRIKYGFSVAETFKKQETQYISIGVGI